MTIKQLLESYDKPLNEDLNSDYEKIKQHLEEIKEEAETYYNGKQLNEKNYNKLKNWIDEADKLIEEFEKVKNSDLDKKQKKKMVAKIAKFVIKSNILIASQEEIDIWKTLGLTNGIGAVIGFIFGLLLGPAGVPFYATFALTLIASVQFTALIKRILKRGKTIIPKSKELEKKIEELEKKAKEKKNKEDEE